MKNASLRLHVYLFAPRFAPLVESGAKRHTIRAAGSRKLPRPGDALSLRAWAGKPYRSPHRELRAAVCSATFHIRIESGEKIGRLLDIELNGMLLNPKELDSLARLDGFDDLADMARWYRTKRAIPFEGILIQWESLA